MVLILAEMHPIDCPLNRVKTILHTLWASICALHLTATTNWAAVKLKMEEDNTLQLPSASIWLLKLTIRSSHKKGKLCHLQPICWATWVRKQRDTKGWEGGHWQNWWHYFAFTIYIISFQEVLPSPEAETSSLQRIALKLWLVPRLQAWPPPHLHIPGKVFRRRQVYARSVCQRNNARPPSVSPLSKSEAGLKAALQRVSPIR